MKLCFICAEFEWSVKGAECDDGSDQEDCTKHEQDDAECTGDRSTEVQVGKEDGEGGANTAVDVGHVAFHWILSFWMTDLLFCQ